MWDNKKVKYPAAELLAQHCYEDYKSELDNYYKIYDKVNIALTFCGVILLVFIEHIDLELIKLLFQKPGVIKAVCIIGNVAASLVCSYQIFYSTMILIRLMSGKKIRVFNSIEFRNKDRYTWESDEAALSLITAYTEHTEKLRKSVSTKQKDFDIAIWRMSHALLWYAVSVIIQKIGGLL